MMMLVVVVVTISIMLMCTDGMAKPYKLCTYLEICMYTQAIVAALKSEHIAAKNMKFPNLRSDETPNYLCWADLAIMETEFKAGGFSVVDWSVNNCF